MVCSQAMSRRDQLHALQGLTRRLWLGAVAGAAVSCAAAGPGARGDADITGTWTPIDGSAGPSAGLLQSTVIADREVIIWGGSGPCGDGGACGDGARFDPAIGGFVRVSSDGAPAPRALHTAVWGAGRMLVWGGAYCGGLSSSCGDGAAYEPVLDRWTPLATAGAPSPRGWHTAVFGGGEMIVWGGEDVRSRALYGDGARYDAERDAWRPMRLDDAPTARRYHSALWTGAAMVIWGGDRSATDDEGLADGAAYDPVQDRWHALTGRGAPPARWAHTAVWTGTRMIVWGGLGCGRDRGGPLLCDTGGVYDPVTDTWTAVSNAGSPSARVGHSAVWTGEQMIIWGGAAARCADGSSGECSDGAAYDPSTDRWTPLRAAATPAARAGHAAAWIGSSMFVWGGAGGVAENTYLDGGLYRQHASAR